MTGRHAPRTIRAAATPLPTLAGRGRAPSRGRRGRARPIRLGVSLAKVGGRVAGLLGRRLRNAGAGRVKAAEAHAGAVGRNDVRDARGRGAAASAGAARTAATAVSTTGKGSPPPGRATAVATACGDGTRKRTAGRDGRRPGLAGRGPGATTGVTTTSAQMQTVCCTASKEKDTLNKSTTPQDPHLRREKV